MEAKLAEFRKTHIQKKPLINWHEIKFRFISIFSFLRRNSYERKPKEEVEENEQEKEEEETSINSWQIILLKFFVWLTLLLIFIRLEFGAIYFIISLLYVMWSSLGRRRERNQLSAYSVFNPNFEKIQGTFSAEDYDRQLRRGGSPFFSS
ncbi:unnamed protein product [Rotaria socialis]|uniref:SAYSvFN domain-containing protein n=1 Tax=Rotaria socialis TaxID=392032 RepID=A0A820LY07_9BILA|nr:unnamed protein product [Rotaria socialis]CAF3393168.1 unnamed protein product [Rotaria socialis]CAF3433940.1 unnamed protein product [Rotaria socialis]CAF3507188.1 unnamed protein product [Rotaria socialis]CAF3738083.1 unnamed protein product [Rotaria socialis]